MMTVDQIMERLGGFVEIADKTGIPATTVHSWKRKNFVPKWRQPVLLELAARTNKPLAETDFPTKSGQAA